MAKQNQAWPVLKTYDQNHLLRIAMPIGGIGTGTISIGGRGNLRDFEICNRPAKGFTPDRSFFALYAKPIGGKAVTRALEGPIQEVYYEGHSGAVMGNHGMPRFAKCSFAAAYPLGQVRLSDPGVPLDVRIEAFNPMIPGEADASGIPIAVLRFVLTNRTNKAVDASVCGTLPNFIGKDGSAGQPSKNVNEFREAPGVKGIFMRSDGVDRNAEQWGTLALSTTARAGVTYRTAWTKRNWGTMVLDFWDDFSSDGKLENRDPQGAEMPQASLAAMTRIPAKATREITFLITWHFPNRQTWSPIKQPAPAAQAQSTCNCASGCCAQDNPNCIGNYYTTQYADAWDVAVKTAPRLPKLEADTVRFVRAFCDSTLPEALKDAALSNVSTLRTQTAFRTPDGNFYGWEGCSDHTGCCHGSCTHVWNYEQATAHLFADLSRKMRRVEFLHTTLDTGLMCFRAELPLGQGEKYLLAAADGQMGCLMKLYRDWQLSGDDAMLRELWPQARKSIEFCWIPGGWDADQDGVMEGCQHNTMDVEYYGPNPQCNVLYLLALRSGEEMACYLGEIDFADTCRKLFERGSRWMDENLFNGEYYFQDIRPISDVSRIAKGLRHESMGAKDPGKPELQIGSGCEGNQLFGQQLAHVAGLGHLLNPQHIRTALRSMMKYNFRESLSDHFNYLRSYALNDEAGLLVCTWPREGRPDNPFPYASEVWTGLEYMVAAHLISEGMTRDGLKLIEAARARHDGAKRNPFDEPECGHHYARAMSSWACVLAYTGFRYSGVNQSMEFAPAEKAATWFWSNGWAWGVIKQTPRRGGVQVELTVLHGELPLQQLTIRGVGKVDMGKLQRLPAGKTLQLTINRS